MKTFLSALLLCFVLILMTFYFIGLQKTLKGPQESTVVDKVPTNTNLIKSVAFENCDIVVTTATDSKEKIGQLETNGAQPPQCITNPKYQISPSGKYLIFEDVSGGVDLWIRIYSAETQKINTLGVWGTSSLLDIEFLKDDRVAILSGYPDIPNEQWLALYNIPNLYKDYPNNLDEYGYFLYGLEANTQTLPIRTLPGDYFDLTQDSEKLYLYGGYKSNPVKRTEFLLKDL